jgi:hypothetical protein
MEAYGVKGTFLTLSDLSERSGDPAVLGRGRPSGHEAPLICNFVRFKVQGFVLRVAGYRLRVARRLIFSRKERKGRQDKIIRCRARPKTAESPTRTLPVVPA